MSTEQQQHSDPPPVADSQPPEVPAKKRKRYAWTFKSGTLAVMALALWAELLVWLAIRAQGVAGGERWGYAIGFFFAALPILALLVYRWPLVFDFFRSVKVGVSNLILIGLASILGVLFHQEDPNRPIPPDGAEEIRNWEASQGPWTPAAIEAYRQYDSFRHAHAYFVYHLTHPALFYSLPGVNANSLVDEEEISDKMDHLRTQIPELRARFGEEFAVAIEASSERGLYTRSENQEILLFEEAWDDFWFGLWTWSDRLDLLRVYKADWFATLWVVLFFGVLSNTFRGGWRRLLKPKKWGFVVTHSGILLIVIGGAWGRFTEYRGILELNIGESSTQYVDYDGTRRPFGDKPFLVRLDAFRADHFDVLEVVYAVDGPDGEPTEEFAGLSKHPKERVYKGKLVKLDYDEEQRPWLELEVLDYIPQAQIFRELRAAGEDDPIAFPLARLGIAPTGREVEKEEILTPLFERSLVHGPTASRARYTLVDDLAQARELLTTPPKPRYGILRAVTPSDPRPQAPFDAITGARKTIQIGERDYQVQVLAATPILRLNRNESGQLDHMPTGVPMENEEPANPAVKVRITGPGGKVEERWITQEQFHRPNIVYPELEFEFLWDDWGSPARSRWLVMQLPDDTLMCGAVGDPDSLKPVERGERFAIDRDHELAVLEAYRQAVPMKRPEPIQGADFFHPASGAIRLMVRAGRDANGGFQVEREFVLSGRADSFPERVLYDGPDGEERQAFLFFKPDLNDLPFEWRSRLTMMEETEAHGGWEEAMTGTIRVNDYLYYKGYRFFQTNANASDPTYSGIGIVYDPGIETVLLGLYMLAFGTIVVFIINPLVTKTYRGA